MNVVILFCKSFIRVKMFLSMSHTEHVGEKCITSALQEYFGGVFSSPSNWQPNIFMTHIYGHAKSAQISRDWSYDIYKSKVRNGLAIKMITLNKEQLGSSLWTHKPAAGALN